MITKEMIAWVISVMAKFWEVAKEDGRNGFLTKIPYNFGKGKDYSFIAVVKTKYPDINMIELYQELEKAKAVTFKNIPTKKINPKTRKPFYMKLALPYGTANDTSKVNEKDMQKIFG